MLKKVQDIFVRTVNFVENRPVPFVRYYFLFAAILAVRLALEFFSSRRLFTLDDILHIGLWFIFIVLAFLIQLHLFSGEKIMKVAKLVIVFFSIALTAPIIDLIVTGGVGAKMNYLSLHSWKDVAWSYVTIGGSSLSRGATPGIRIEIALLVIASFNYVRTKQNSILKGIIAAISIYTILFMSGAVPLLLGYIVSTFHLQYQPGDQSTVLLLLSLDIFLLLLAMFRHAPSQGLGMLKKVPWGGFIVALCCAAIGIFLALKNYPGNWQLTPTTLFWFPLLAMMVICFAGYTALQHPGSKSLQPVAILNGLLLLIVVISCMISAKTFFTSILTWAVLFLLHDPVLALKRVPILRNLLNALVLLSVAFIGFCSFGAPMIGFPSTWLFVLFATAFVGGMFTELGLKGNGIFTTNTRGKDPAKIICIILLAAMFAGADLLLLRESIFHVYFMLTAIPPACIIWLRPTKTQYILLSLVPAYGLLLLSNYY